MVGWEKCGNGGGKIDVKFIFTQQLAIISKMSTKPDRVVMDSIEKTEILGKEVIGKFRTPEVYEQFQKLSEDRKRSILELIVVGLLPLSD